MIPVTGEVPGTVWGPVVNRQTVLSIVPFIGYSESGVWYCLFPLVFFSGAVSWTCIWSRIVPGTVVTLPVQGRFPKTCRFYGLCCNSVEKETGRSQVQFPVSLLHSEPTTGGNGCLWLKLIYPQFRSPVTCTSQRLPWNDTLILVDVESERNEEWISGDRRRVFSSLKESVSVLMRIKRGCDF